MVSVQGVEVCCTTNPGAWGGGAADLPGVQYEVRASGFVKREFIGYTTSMIADEDPLRGLLFY